MDVLRFPHDDKNKRDLFGWIGEVCASASVRAELGAPVTSAPGDVWFVAVEGKRLLGFCGVSILKNRKAKLHGMVVLAPSQKSIEETLKTMAEVEAIGHGATEILVVDKETRQKEYEGQGWKVIGDRGKQYRLFSKALEVPV
uniref:N-acetyltransferase domain-containing protein n=1 Tax=Leptospirillum ferrodiazotrophum TaxID=412449 RepID=C6HZM7_9BACT|nr:MAG: hypothetical protein UBAL3_95390023 [Leptospirillum ferrodiazotrophum]